MGAYSNPSTWSERAFAPGTEVHADAGPEEGDPQPRGPDGGGPATPRGAVFRVVKNIGRGGMGEVYEVRCLDDGQRYALKCLRLEHSQNTRTIERTRREALTLRSLRHPNLVRVHATGVREDGLIWMVMDLLEGHTLAQVKQRMGRLPLPWALRMGRDVAAGLAAVHTCAVHRDVKPDNVHLGNDAAIRVLDLGAGKFHHFGLLTTGSSTVGTVPYMSPEQISTGGLPLDARSDLFSLGVLLVELVSGGHPFAPDGLARENVFTLVNRIVSSEPVSLRALAPWVPAYVVETVDRATRKDRAARFASAVEMGDAITAALDRLEREVGTGEPLSTLVKEMTGEAIVGADPAVPTVQDAAVVSDVGLLETEEADTRELRRR